jgi:hypothetical protein
MRGGILVNFDEFVNDLGVDAFNVIVNNVTRDLHFTDIKNYYSTFVFPGDNVSFTVFFDTSVVPTVTVKRIDYTTDDEGGDLGIKETPISFTIATPSPTSYRVDFIASTVPSAYNFKYVIDASTAPSPTVTATPTATPTPTLTPTLTPTATPTLTPTATPTPTLTMTPTPTPTAAPAPGTLLWTQTELTGATTNQVIYGNDNHVYVSNTQAGFNQPNTFIRKYTTSGTRVTTYNPSPGSQKYSFIALGQQSNGKIIASGDWLYNNSGINRFGLARFNLDGSLDFSFISPFTGSTFVPSELLVLPDDSILYIRNGLIFKIGIDGGTASGGTINAVEMNFANDGKIIVASPTGGGTRYKLNHDLTIDTTYTFSGTSNGGVQLSTGDIIWYGGCTVVKTNSSGVIDTGFTCTIFSDDCAQGVRRPLVQSDDKIILIGKYFKINAREIGSIIRLNTDGSVDSTWDPPIRGNNGFFGVDWFDSRTVSDCATDGANLYTTGDYFKYNGVAATLLTKLSL